MIRCVVLDDEPPILRNIVRKIEQTGSDFKVVATALNGQDGCKAIKEYRPDVIFTDISMPVMNGLEVLAWMKQENISASYVILSGYREFEYAKEAMRYGARDYLLKPIDPRKLAALLKELAEEVKEKRKREKEKILERVRYGLFMRERLIETDDIFFDGGKKALTECSFYIGSYGVKRKETSKNKSGFGIELDWEKICVELCGERQAEAFLFYGEEQIWTSVFFLSADEAKGYELGKSLYEFVQRQTSKAVTCVISDPMYSLGEVEKTEVKMRQVLEKYQVFAASSLIYVGQTPQESMPLPQEAFSRLKTSAEKKKLFDVWDRLGELLDICENRKYMLCDLTKAVGNILKYLEEISDARAESLAAMVIAESGSYEELKRKIAESWQNHGKIYHETGKTADTESMMKQIDDYIVRHYREDMRIQELAQKFGFNPSYLSTAFRKYKGVSPNEYISEKRIEEAKFLLKMHPEMTIREIGKRMGYEDGLYFSRVFKKATSVSPAEYRNQKWTEEEKAGRQGEKNDE